MIHNEFSTPGQIPSFRQMARGATGVIGQVIILLTLANSVVSTACRTPTVERACAPEVCDPLWTFSAWCQTNGGEAEVAGPRQTFVADTIRVEPALCCSVAAVTLIQRSTSVPVTQSSCLVRIDPEAHEVLLEPQFTPGPEVDGEPAARYVTCLIQELVPTTPGETVTWRIRYAPEVAEALDPPRELPDATVLMTYR
jgi:hypothetical protein